MSYFSGGWKTKFKSLAGLVSGESLFPGSQMAVFALGGRASWFPDGRLLSESENFLVPRWPSSLSVGELPGSQMAISLNAHRVEEALWGLFESAK